MKETFRNVFEKDLIAHHNLVNFSKEETFTNIGKQSRQCFLSLAKQILVISRLLKSLETDKKIKLHRNNIEILK